MTWGVGGVDKINSSLLIDLGLCVFEKSEGRGR